MKSNTAQNIVQLGMSEVPAIRPEILVELQREMGLQNCQDVVERAVLELSDRLWNLENQLKQHNLSEVQRISNSLIAISQQIGLAEFAAVAQNLANSISQSDKTTVHAIAARLSRVGEASLFYALRFHDDFG
ncbi:hypothetical protein GCM10008927_10180 [Amylibacter ulvae]|uniref:Uncharacterized protein n=1 Tax=Paramylibacter ulvae TaxID=1651968 RepID=A0ABQ3CWH3_9RHOB|nr:hypothetical protein [Amylibacter ulvae]GHA47329.1 hypothetical protein GCM10008927_10180 [Amylibacter ulvae]